jgi:phenylalanyl-tRNA synthetase beta chain
MLNDTEVVQGLERAGMEVEQVIASPSFDKRIVVGLVKKVVQHPRADKLHLTEVEVGKQSYGIVCGANNVREGMKVAVAQIGSVLPGGETIGSVRLRGELSEGMLCSERELKLGNDHNGILELSSDLEVGMPLCDVYPSDGVIELKTPANRWDVQSVVGLARELAGMTSAEMSEPTPPTLPNSHGAPVAVEKGAQASRYMIGSFEVEADPFSPAWMQHRLASAGVRSLGGIVDVTNYVLLEYGQPLHAFDAKKVHPPIAVRTARQGEKLQTLDGNMRNLFSDDLVIADQRGPIALAGVMGGASTEVGPETTSILLEAAVFDAVQVRKTAKRHGLRTEASARFERGLPVELPPLGLARAAELLAEYAGGQYGAVTDQQNKRSRAGAIELPMEALLRLSGLVITHKEAIGALHKLHIEAEKTAISSDKIVQVPKLPWWRGDLSLPEDLVEEVVRVVGYDRLPSTLPSWRPREVSFDRNRSKRRLVRDVLYAAGLFEVMTYSFVSEQQLEWVRLRPEGHLKLKNPLSVEQAYMRSSMLASHLSALARNRHYPLPLGVYEISRVFRPTVGEEHDEPLVLSVMLTRDSDSYAYAKGMLDMVFEQLGLEFEAEPRDEAPYAQGRAAKVVYRGQAIGSIGQVEPALVRDLKIEGEVAAFELDLGLLLESPVAKVFEGLERFPTIARDITVELPLAVTWAEVAGQLVGTKIQFVRDYYGEGLEPGSKALTFRFVLAHPERTPTEDEAAQLEAKILATLARKFGAKRR